MVSILTRSHSTTLGRLPASPPSISFHESYPEPPVIKGGVDRFAIFLDLGLHNRVFQDRPETCIDALAVKQPAKSSSPPPSPSLTSSSSSSSASTPSSRCSSDPSPIVRASSVKRIVRSISVRVRSTQSKLPAAAPRRFSYPSVDNSKQQQQQQLPSLHVVLEQSRSESETKLERWNSQKGRKWEAIRARKREEEIKRRFEEKKFEQRLRAVNKVLGRFSCMGAAELEEAEGSIPFRADL